MMTDQDVTGGRRRFAINDAELDALQELIWNGYPFAALLYYQELRPYMDYTTGIVGDRRRVSEKAMQECLERHAKRGSHYRQKSRPRGFIQRQLQALEDGGLLLRLPKQDRGAPMRFRLVLADKGLIRPQDERTMSGQGGANSRNPVSMRLVVGGSEHSKSTDERTTSGKTGNTRETTSLSSTPEGGDGVVSSGVPPCPHLQIITLFNTTFPECTQVKPELWPGTSRAKALQSRWRESYKHRDMRFWQWYFSGVRKNRFYLGENPSGWKVTLEHLVTKAKFVALVEKLSSDQRGPR